MWSLDYCEETGRLTFAFMIEDERIGVRAQLSNRATGGYHIDSELGGDDWAHFCREHHSSVFAINKIRGVSFAHLSFRNHRK